MKVSMISVIILYCNGISCINKRQIAFPDEDESACTTPSGKSGNCIPLVRCKRLANKRNVQLLRRSVCGFDDDIPYVCCPQTNARTTRRPKIVTTKRRKTTRRPTTQSTESGSVIIEDSGDNSKDLVVIKPKKLPKNCGNTSVTQTTRIVGGKEALPGAWPWMAAIFIEDSNKFSAQCGGALISDREVITASHCVVDNGQVLKTSSVFVRLGEHNIEKIAKEDAEQDYEVIKITAHPQFEAKVYKNDIAILKLAKKVRFNDRVWPICLPYDTKVLKSKENIGRSGYITGWGRLRFNGDQSEVLHEAPIEIVSQEKCAQAFKKYVTISDVYLCAGTIGSTRDSCQGDSGGPLFQIDPNNKRYYLTGVVSFGRRCATPGFPGVYARVSHFLNWISTNI